MKSIASKILNVISILILVIALLILLSAVMTSPGNIPEIAGHSFMRVVTGSMEPTIKTDSIVVIDRIDGNNPDELAEIEVGDIICFYSTDEETSGSPTTHRVVEIKDTDFGRQFVTKGDANALADEETVMGSNVLGIVVWKCYIIGLIVRLLLNPLVFFPVIVIPLIVLILINLKDAINRGKEIAKEEEETAVRDALEELKRRKAEEEAEAEAAKEEEREEEK